MNVRNMMAILLSPQAFGFHTLEDYTTYYDKLPELVWVTDASGNVIFLNAWYKAYVGIDDISRHNWLDCLHPDDVDHMSRERAVAFQHKSIFHTHYRLKNHVGQYRWFLSRATPMLDERSEVIRWFGVNTDINDKIEAIEKEKNQNVFFGANTHDLKTPITGILGLTELVLQTELTPSQRADLKSILQCGLSVLNLLTNILDFCRIETKKIELDILPFSMETVAEHVVKLAKLTKNQDITLNVEDMLRRPHLIEGDAGRVTQVLNNLVTNAVKFTPDEGKIIVNVHLMSHEHLLKRGVDDALANVYVVCTIEDNGSGIDSETMRNLFDPFTQSTNQNRAVTTKGHGLGLYICKNLVTLMNGYIFVQSKPGVGTEFQITFPYYPYLRKLSHHSSFSHDESVNQNHCIMIIEDNTINRDVATRFLQKDDYQVCAYANGADSFEAFKVYHAKIDLVLMDLHLPDLNGATLAKMFREYEASLQTDLPVPIIAFTASSLPSELSTALANGMNGVIIKPFIRKDFLLKVSQTIRR